MGYKPILSRKENGVIPSLVLRFFPCLYLPYLTFSPLHYFLTFFTLIIISPTLILYSFLLVYSTSSTFIICLHLLLLLLCLLLLSCVTSLNLTYPVINQLPKPKPFPWILSNQIAFHSKNNELAFRRLVWRIYIQYLIHLHHHSSFYNNILQSYTPV